MSASLISGGYLLSSDNKLLLWTLWRPVETITDPRFGRDVLRSIRIWLDFLTEALHEYTQIVDLISVIGSPHGLQQFPMWNSFVRMQRQVTQEVEFLRRQMGRDLSFSHSSGGEVDRDLAKLEPGRGG